MPRLLLALALVCSPTLACAAEAPEPLPEKTVKIVRTATLVGGGVAGLAIGIGLVAADDPSGGLFVEGAEAWRVGLTAVPSLLVLTGSGALTTRLFAEAWMRWRIPWWASLPVGMVFGAVAGATTGALGFSTLATVGNGLDILDTGSLSSWGEVMGMSLLAGALWGGFIGVVPGAVLGPTLSITFKF